MNLPNKLTIIRIILIPVFIALFFIPFDWNKLAAMIVFAVACLTDFFDGYIARKENLVTQLGKFLDPMADKMIVACALIALCVTTPVVDDPAVFTVCVTVFSMLILCRELLISGFRTVAANRGLVLAADMFGKTKTVSQMVALILLLPVEDYFYVAGNPAAARIVYYVGFSFLALATLLTVMSSINYIVRNRAVLGDEKPQSASAAQDGETKIDTDKESE